MSENCGIENEFLINTSSSGLHSLRTTALDMIRRQLFQDADMVNSPTTVTLPTSPFGGQQILLPTELIYEIEKTDFDNYTGVDNTDVKGAYMMSDGKVYLVKNMWCIETVIHEILHSCSRFSTEPVLQKFLNWYEGLTELLTGYIIFRELSDCYEKCFRPVGNLCQITYDPYVKLWVAFCNFVSIRTLIPIYFPTENSLDQEISEWVERVNQLGFPNFTNPIVKGGMSTDTKFKIICQKTFGNQFKQICKDRNLWTDFSRILNT